MVCAAVDIEGGDTHIRGYVIVPAVTVGAEVRVVPALVVRAELVRVVEVLLDSALGVACAGLVVGTCVSGRGLQGLNCA